MTKKYRAALIGLGNIAWKYDRDNCDNEITTHMEAYLNSDDVEVVGGFDPCEDARNEFSKKYQVKAFDSIEELIEEKVDILSICSPSKFHYDHLKRALSSDIKMVWLEKPPVENITEFKEMVSLIGDTKVNVNYMRRHHPFFKKIREITKNKNYGVLQSCEVSFSKGFLTNGSHMVDLIAFIVDEKVSIDFSNITKDGSSGVGVGKTKTGTSVLIKGSDVPYHYLESIFVFEKGRIVVKNGGKEWIEEERIENADYPGTFSLKQKYTESFEQNLGFIKEGLDDLIQNFEQKRDSDLSFVKFENTLKLISELIGE